MSKLPLIIKRLSIQRMPGLLRGLSDYNDFAPHINIIFGPNGSGKSSTARAIKELIWRHASGDITATAATTLGMEEWEIKVDGQKATTRKNGEDASLTGIPTWDGSNRYSLALHELIKAIDDDLARQVIKDSTGYDVDAAQKNLAYSLSLPTTKTKIFQDCIGATSAHRKILNSQDTLKNKQETLARLSNDKENAERSLVLLEWNCRLLEFSRIKNLSKEAEDKLSTIPPVLATMSGQEYKDLQEAQHQLIDIKQERAALEETMSDAVKLRTGLNFPEVGLPNTLLDELDAKITALSNKEKGLLEHEKEIAEAFGKEKAALKPFEASLDVSEWGGITWMDVDMLEVHLQKAHGVLSRKAAIEASILEMQRLMGEDDSANTINIRAAIRVLTGWLQDIKPEKSKNLPNWSLWVIAGLAIIPAIAVLLFGVMGMFAILIVIISAVIIYFSGKKTEQGTEGVRQADYHKLGFSMPSEWMPETVQKKLGEHVEQLERAVLQKHLEERIAIHKTELGELKPDLEEMDRQYKRLKDQLLLVPNAPSSNIKSFDAMYWFLHYAREWHKHYSRRLALEEAYMALKIHRDDVLEEINKLFSSANANTTADSISAKTIWQDLKQLDQSWKATGTTIENARNGIESYNQRITQLALKTEGIYIKTAIEPGEEQRLNDLVLLIPEYTMAKQNCLSQNALLENKQQSLQAHPLFITNHDELDTVTIEMILARMPALEAEVANLEDLKKDITSIDTQIRIAEAGNSLEVALKTKDDRMADMEDFYDKNLASNTGKLLVNALKKRSDDRDRPPVFKQANLIFNRITNGRYELRLKSSEPPSFGAHDTVLNQWRHLDELSTGTRIQLLLSVRLAFINSVESSVAVPILADELLGNSDIRRAAAIVDALTEFSREGRQIFYFTSKEDEVAKWKELLVTKPDISYTIVELNGHDNESYALNHVSLGTAFAGIHLQESVPEAEGKTHEEYGKLLNISPFDIMSDSADRLHIWYILDDLVIINRILRIGINYWGHLRSFLASGGIIEGLDAYSLQNLNAKIAVFERFKQLYEKGRPRKVNRSVLENSEIISSSFIDMVCDKSEELDNDPLQLLESLANKGVPGFRTNSIERLKEYFLEEGYISEEVTLSATEIWVQLSAFISQSSVNIEDSQRFISRILS